MTIDEAIKKIERIRTEAPPEGVKIMKEEVSVHNKTNGLYNSINSIPQGQDAWSIGSDLYYAKFVQRGRGPVAPIEKKALHWMEGQADVFAMSAKKYDGDNFCHRTADRLRAFIRSII